ncbi:hypothetical protein [Cellulomonas sp. ATA003]|uniref:hypothetical protein n=1 Tax=Cellulomonas sp. ATA003 TaxID=3073064 RepID=UPI00287308E7|nr:hypothetical protein [Cellulomonas sp. ATA003]WNB85425.1 hypothetical protein REH70_17875 [Cellulomonas sp. ATA003]
MDDVDALADAVAAHLRAPGRLRAAMLEGQVWARAHLDDSRTAQETMGVLTQVAHDRGGRAARLRSGRRG